MHVIIVVEATKEEIVPHFIKHETIVKRKDITLKCVGEKKSYKNRSLVRRLRLVH